MVETSTKYLRNSRQDEGFPVNSTIQGIILETTEGYKVGLEHLSNIWVQPYKLSFNVANEAATMGIAKSDNTEMTFTSFFFTSFRASVITIISVLSPT